VASVFAFSMSMDFTFRIIYGVDINVHYFLGKRIPGSKRERASFKIPS